MVSLCEIVPIASNAVWCCCELYEDRPLHGFALDTILDAIRKTPAFQTTAATAYSDEDAMLSEVKSALQHPLRTPPAFPSLQRVLVVMPETWEEYSFCDWDGSGHFNMSKYAKPGLPTLAQLIAYIQMMEAACDDVSHFVIHLSSKNCRRTGAVLNGGLKVLLHGQSAEEVWGQLRLVSPAPSEDPALAWDRFLGPFAPTETTTSATNVQVEDCLLGLQFARDLGWIFVNSKSSSFDRHEWDFLRRKFDLTWVIPDEIAAMGHPSITAQNPAYPGLLDPPESSKEHVVQPKRRDEQRSRIDSVQSTAYSPTSSQRSSSPSPSLNCLDEWDFPEDVVAGEREINSVLGEVNFSIHGLEDDDTEEGQSPLDRRYQDVHWKPTIIDLDSVIDLDSAADAIISRCFAPSFASYFQRVPISKICRLNFVHECIEQDTHFSVLRDMDVSLHECAFTDGGIPSKTIVQSFLELCRDARERGNQRVAVHCVAGLGRTGTLVAAYAVAHHGLTGKAWHGWVRMCRPGSIQTECQEAFVRRLMPKAKKTKKSSSPTNASRFGSLLKKVTSWGSNLSGSR